MSETAQSCYYRLSPSPPSSGFTNGYSQTNGNYSHSHNGNYSTSNYEACLADNDSPLSYSPSSSSNSVPSYTEGVHPNTQGQNIYRYSEVQNGETMKLANLRNLAPVNASYENFNRFNDNSPSTNCTCVANAQLAQTFINLSRQLQGTVQYLQHLPEHSQGFQCNVYKRIYELNHILQYVFLTFLRHRKLLNLLFVISGGDLFHNSTKATPYSNGFESQPPHLRSPAESGLMTPLSVASHPNSVSAPTTPHTVPPGPVRQWDTSHNAGNYNPYFPQVPPNTDAYD